MLRGKFWPSSSSRWRNSANAASAGLRDSALAHLAEAKISEKRDPHVFPSARRTFKRDVKIDDLQLMLDEPPAGLTIFSSGFAGISKPDGRCRNCRSILSYIGCPGFRCISIASRSPEQAKTEVLGMIGFSAPLTSMHW